MRFENPEIKEGVNVSKEHPLKEFLQLLLGFVLLLLIIIFVLGASASYFAMCISISRSFPTVKFSIILSI